MRVLRHLYVLAGAHPAVRCDVILLDCWPWPDHSLAAGRGVLLLHARHRQPLLLATATRRPRTRCRVGWGRRVRSGRGALGRWISIRAQGQVISRVRPRASVRRRTNLRVDVPCPAGRPGIYLCTTCLQCTSSGGGVSYFRRTVFGWLGRPRCGIC